MPNFFSQTFRSSDILCFCILEIWLPVGSFGNAPLPWDLVASQWNVWEIHSGPNLACSDHLRLYGLVCYDLRNSPKFTSDGKVMKDGSEKNSAVNLKIALILSYNWHGEIGIVKMSIL